MKAEQQVRSQGRGAGEKGVATQCPKDRVKNFGLTLKEKPLRRGNGTHPRVAPVVPAYREWSVGGRSDENWLCWTNSSFDKCCECCCECMNDLEPSAVLGPRIQKMNERFTALPS